MTYRGYLIVFPSDHVGLRHYQNFLILDPDQIGFNLDHLQNVINYSLARNTSLRKVSYRSVHCAV